MNEKEYFLLNKIKYFDHVINPMELATLRKKIIATPMTWTGKDDPNTPVNTLTKDFAISDPIFVKLQTLLFQVEPNLQHFKFMRAGINLIMPQTNPSYFHIDGPNTITCLFYINSNIQTNDGGETQFEFADTILGIKPIPGRLCIFDGNINHRTSYFRNKERVTVFLKYYKNSLYNIFNV